MQRTTKQERKKMHDYFGNILLMDIVKIELP